MGLGYKPPPQPDAKALAKKKADETNKASIAQTALNQQVGQWILDMPKARKTIY